MSATVRYHSAMMCFEEFQKFRSFHWLRPLCNIICAQADESNTPLAMEPLLRDSSNPYYAAHLTIGKKGIKKARKGTIRL